ncbi:unnamed protein product [Owenia fusiformis]|uniref:Uncharacterized protein n=1 Tax=Owenia fusiformis TaxID=6347 RepID=A0A8J1TVZ9_OWEFU|nr:unnamed protein product [Owenia fusiformis]
MSDKMGSQTWTRWDLLRFGVDEPDCTKGKGMNTQRYIQINRSVRKRSYVPRIMILIGVIVMCFLCIFYQTNTQDADIPNHNGGGTFRIENGVNLRKLLNTTESNSGGGLYPPRAFTMEQLRSGAVVLHAIGMLYMFVALAIVCDEFFVPALGVITQRLDISEDVAGATFMAAGGSAPELFTSLIGVFLAESMVGIGTIVGSAVFNILFVIGMCAIFSKEALKLTWWPLFRDVTFYSISLAMLIGFFTDSMVYWYEALCLFIWYFVYVIFMKYNEKIEAKVKSLLRRKKVHEVHVSTDDLLKNEEQPIPSGRPQRSCSVPILRVGSSKYRQGVLQLMIHTIDPLHDGRNMEEKALQLHALATVKVVMNTRPSPQTNNNQSDSGKTSEIPTITNGQISGHVTVNGVNGTITGDIMPASNGYNANNPMYIDTAETEEESRGPDKISRSTVNSLESDTSRSTMITTISNTTDRQVIMHNTSIDTKDESDSDAVSVSKEIAELEEENEPLDMSWPEGWRKRVTYVLVAPLTFPMWLTLPDVRRPEKERWFPITFLGSIIWIMGFSYLMVWWATVIGDTIGINPEVMGITFLAAGTSIPDLITSVIVAKKGFGDMAVSSSVGSNIFDVTVGLPFPWLLWYAIYQRPSINVDSDGLFCSIVLLFLMLILVITAIAIFKWQMSKALGASMFVLYVVFLTISLLLLANIIPCLLSP